MANGQSRPERIGHRGAPREFDENTLDGFLRAVERGADAVELDVHLTRDGAVVVHHDPEIVTPDGRRIAIRSLDLGAVEACRLPRGGRVPTLAAVMGALVNRATVYVELKGEMVGEAAIHVARSAGGRYAFHSFDHRAVTALHARWPDLQYGVLFDEGAAVEVDRYPVRDLWAHWRLVNAALVDAVHRAGRRLVVWTVNDRDVARRLTALGVDGLCTDDVRLLDALAP